MDATRRFDHGALRVELDHNAIEVAGAFMGRTQIQIEKRAVCPFLPIYCQKFAWDCLHYASGSLTL
ncbi:MAG: hypothetical protein AMXMBFR60_12960 [Chloroflexota bacterium]